jgi:hypothetical protein
MIKVEFTGQEIGMITTVLWQFKCTVKFAVEDEPSTAGLLKELNVVLQKFQDATVEHVLENHKEIKNA